MDKNENNKTYYTENGVLKERVEKDIKYNHIIIPSQVMDGLDGFDTYILSSGERIEKAYVDYSLSEFGALEFFRDKEISEILPHISRVDYRAGIFPELCFCMGIEALLRMEITRRAQYIRMLLCELFRISNHIYFLANISYVVGYEVVYNLALLEREKVLRVIEGITGSRILPNYIRVGGVKKDISDELLKDIEKMLKGLFKSIAKIEKILLDDVLIAEKLERAGIIRDNDATDYGVTGPNLRATGARYDLRKSRNYLAYHDFSFTVPLGRYGDCRDRISVRIREIYQSLKIIAQIIGKIPIEATRKIVDTSRIYLSSCGTSSVECPHGVFKIYMEAKANKITVSSIMGPSKNSLNLAGKILENNKIEDLNLILASLDISAGEIIC